MYSRRLIFSTAVAAAAATLLLAPAASAIPISSLTPSTGFAHTATAAPLSLPKLRLQSKKTDWSVHVVFPVPPEPKRRCGRICRLWEDFSQRVRTAARRLGSDAEALAYFIAYSHDETLPIPKSDDGRDEERGRVDDEARPRHPSWVDEPETPSGSRQWGHGDDDSDFAYPDQPPLLMAVGLLALAIGFISLRGVHYLHRRTARLCLEHPLPLPTVSEARRCRTFDPRSARRHRRRVQQRAVTRCLRAIVHHRWTRGSAASSMPPGPPLISTVESEIACVREIADLMDNVVAAERGMARSARAYACAAPEPSNESHLRDLVDGHVPPDDAAGEGQYRAKEGVLHTSEPDTSHDEKEGRGPTIYS